MSQQGPPRPPKNPIEHAQPRPPAGAPVPQPAAAPPPPAPTRSANAFDPLVHLRRRARRLIIMPPDAEGVRLVYAVTHVHSPELAGLPAIEVGGLEKEIADAERLATRISAAKTDAERKRLEEEAKQLREHLNREALKDVFGNEAKRNALVKRSRGIVIAAVEAAGVAGHWVPLKVIPPGEEDEVDNTTQPPGTHPSDVCADLSGGEGEPLYLRPLRFVEGPSDHDRGEVSVFDLDDMEVMRLGALCQGAFSVSASVSPLRETPAADGVGGQDGEAVRPAAERVPARSGSGGGGSRRAGRANRPGG